MGGAWLVVVVVVVVMVVGKMYGYTTWIGEVVLCRWEQSGLVVVVVRRVYLFILIFR